MDTPFPFDTYVTGKDLVGRRRDCDLLGTMISQGISVYMREPPKSGVSSVVRQTLFERRLQGDHMLVAGLSLMGMRRPEALLRRFGEAAIRCCATTPDEFRETVGTLLKNTCFVFDEKEYAEKDNIISYARTPNVSDMEEMFSLPWRLAARQGKRMLMVLDSFDEIVEFDDAGKLLDSMEKAIGANANGQCSFIFCGSRVNAMKHIFEDAGHWFRRGVKRLALSPLDPKDIAAQVLKGFLSGGKVIDKDMLTDTCEKLRCNVWYINQFFYLCDTLSRGYIVQSTFDDALSCMLAVHEVRFRVLVDSLTTFQVSLLHAICDGVTKFTSAEVISRYGLSSSANVKRLKDALKKKEIITSEGGDTYEIIDPLFDYWLKNKYFRQYG